MPLVPDHRKGELVLRPITHAATFRVHLLEEEEAEEEEFTQNRTRGGGGE